MTNQPNRSLRSIRRHLLAGGGALILLIAGFGGWAVTTELSGAVIGSGSLVVESNVKKVQHPTGGVVGELRVRDGERVKAGTIVVRLDETVSRASLAIVLISLDESAVRQARLEAERDGAETIAFSENLIARITEAEFGRLIDGERKLFEFRKNARLGKKSQLQERIAQLREEVQGLTGQAAAKKKEIELINRELEGVRDLWAKNLIAMSKLTSLEREAVRLDGERSQLMASAAQAKGRTTETELQIIQIEQDLRSEVSKELREIQTKVAEFAERKIAAEDQLKRIDIRAPQDGIVHQLAVHTIGGVISASEPLMVIVPENDALTVEARVAPQDIDQLQLGQTAALRFSTFSQRTTPEINGMVSRVSADTSQDAKTAASYYLVRISMQPEEIARLGDVKLLPGMPVEAFIKTDQRTVMSYLVKPLHDQIARAFRER